MIREYAKTEVKNKFGGEPVKDRTKQLRREPLRIGVELEIDGGENPEILSDEIWNIRNSLDFKHDSSLSESGFEIVTQPCSLEYHLCEFPWKDITDLCKDFGYLETVESTGLHINLGPKSSFSDLELLKMALWWSSHPRFHSTVCRRPTNEYCKSTKPQTQIISGYSKENKKNAVSNILLDYIHGSAINFQARERIEFRQFNGTLSLRNILASISYCHMLGEYVKSKSASFFMKRGSRPRKSVMDFIKKEKKYSVLREYLETM